MTIIGILSRAFASMTGPSEGVRPPRNSAEQSSTRSAPPRSASSASSREPQQISNRVLPMVCIFSIRLGGRTASSPLSMRLGPTVTAVANGSPWEGSRGRIEPLFMNEVIVRPRDAQSGKHPSEVANSADQNHHRDNEEGGTSNNQVRGPEKVPVMGTHRMGLPRLLAVFFQAFQGLASRAQLRIRYECQAELVGGLVTPSLATEHQAQIVVCPRRLRSQADSFSKLIPRSLQITFAKIEAAQRVMCFGGGGIGFKGRLQLLSPLVPVAFERCQNTQVVMSSVVAGIDGQQVIELGLGLIIRFAPDPDRTQQLLRAGVRRRDRQCHLKFFESVVRSAKCEVTHG